MIDLINQDSEDGSVSDDGEIKTSRECEPGYIIATTGRSNPKTGLIYVPLWIQTTVFFLAKRLRRKQFQAKLFNIEIFPLCTFEWNGREFSAFINKNM